MRVDRIVRGVLALFGRRRAEAELDEELQAYLAVSAEAKMASGMSRGAAERAARLELGSPAAVKDWVRDAGWESRLEALWHDLRFAARLLLRSKAFALVAIVTLALGTGANAAMFQLLNAIRFQPLPVPRPGELVSITIDLHGARRVGMGYRRAVHTEPIWQALRAGQQAFSPVFAWGNDRWDLATEGESVPADGLYVSGTFFDGLALRPHAGRLLSEADDRQGCGASGAVLSYGFWLARYGGDRAAIGRTITLNRRPFEVIGVAPPGFYGVEVGRSFDVAIPLCAEPLMRGERAGTGRQAVWWLEIMGRLKPGGRLEEAQGHLAALSAGVFDTTVPPSYTGEMARDYRAFTLTATSGATGVSHLRTQYAAHLWLLLGATALVLLVTCANLASLMIARATARGRETAVRLAIGASRGRIVRQMLVESLLIACLAVVAGLLLAGWLSSALIAVLSTEGTRIVLDTGPDWRMFAFLALVAGATCVLVGIGPALRATRHDPGQWLQAGGRSQTDSRGALAFRRGLVVLQVALSMVLVVGALLFTRSLRNLTASELGFRPDVIAAYVDLERTSVPPDRRHHVASQLVDALRGLPGVRYVSDAFIVPLSGPEWNGRIAVRGTPQEGNVYFNAVGPDYFRALEIPVLGGRTFDERDRAGAAATAVVSETFARRFFGTLQVIGETFQMEVPADAPVPSYEVVGLVGDAKYIDLREAFRPTAYLALAQEPALPSPLPLVLRADLPLAALAPAITRAVTDAVPGASLSYDPVSQYIQELLRTDRLMTTLAGLFGSLALTIALVGLYGVMSYSVTRRTAEIGIRMALGADQRRIVRMMLRESGALLAAGGVAGVVLAVFACRSAAHLLYGVGALDLASFALALGGLAAMGLLASWIPARQAASVPPTVALRE